MERFGLPLGPAVADPARPGRFYQRFEYAVLWAEDGSSGQLPIGAMLRDVLLGNAIAPRLKAGLSGTGLYAQYDPASPFGLVSAAALNRTDLRPAF
jgi:hypothetical protein